MSEGPMDPRGEGSESAEYVPPGPDSQASVPRGYGFGPELPADPFATPPQGVGGAVVNYPPPAPYPSYAPGQFPMYGVPTPRNWMGVTALVLGILGIVLTCCALVTFLPMGLLPSVGGVVFGVLGKKAATEGMANNRGLAQAGFITGIIGLAIFAVLVVIVILAAVADAAGWFD